MQEFSPQNTDSMIYSLPSSSYEVGALVQQIAELDEARAIIIDFMQKTIIVHPSSPDDTAVFTEESLTYVLASEELEMLNSDKEWSNVLKQYANDNEEKEVMFCINPKHKKTLKDFQEQVLWTTLVAETAVLLVSQKTLSTHKMWKIRGMHAFLDLEEVSTT